MKSMELAPQSPHEGLCKEIVNRFEQYQQKNLQKVIERGDADTLVMEITVHLGGARSQDIKIAIGGKNDAEIKSAFEKAIKEKQREIKSDVYEITSITIDWKHTKDGEDVT